MSVPPEPALTEERAKIAERSPTAATGLTVRAWGDTCPAMLWTAGADGVADYLSALLRADVEVDLAPSMWPQATVHADDRAQMQAGWTRALRRGEAFSLEFRRRRRDGSFRWSRLEGRPDFDDRGALRGWSGALFDIHDLRACEDQLEQAEQRRHQFLAILGHELRNPLATIVSALQVMDTFGAEGHESAEMREIIRRQAKLMKRLVDDLLDISRLARNKIAMRPARIDLTQWLRDAAQGVELEAQERGVRLALELPAEAVYGDGDVERLRQALDNVLNNALKFTDRGGSIELSLEHAPEARWARIRVRDTGIGMTPETLDQLFAPFSQADDSLHRSYGGLGIGLALAKGLIELNGGRIWAESGGLEAGSMITIELPVRSASSGAGDELAATDRSLRILVVEDRRDAALPLIKLLRSAGHTVELAADGLSGVELASSFQPEAVICDIGLPGIDGYEVARRLRRMPSLARSFLVALTGYGLDTDRQKALDAGFDCHLRKPIDFSELRSVIDVARRSLPLDP